MINPLYERFPDYTIINGQKYRVVTDFREYIKLLELLRDETVDEIEKYYLVMEWFLDIPEGSFEQCLNGLASFMTMNVDQKETEDYKEDGEKESKVLSYTQDAPYILSGFLECYGIDLETIEYMHWWKFQMLINGMNEKCELKKRMNYRSINADEIKDKSERNRIKKIQRQIAITEEVVNTEEIGNAFGNMMW